LLLDFRSPQEADRVSREIGGPWMREHIVPSSQTTRSATSAR
jgi:hypothetical protein